MRMRRLPIVVALAATTVANPATHAASALGQARSSTPHARAVAYAEALLDKAPTIHAESVLDRTPAHMSRPTQTIGATNLVIRARYWRSDKPVKATYRGLKLQQIAGLRLSGYGLHPPRSATPRGGQLDFTATGKPKAIAQADVFVEIRGRGAGSVVGAFAEVVPYPAKPPAEVIPNNVGHAWLDRTARPPDAPAQTPPAVRLGLRRAASLARTVNNLRVQPPGPYSCPAPAPGRTTYSYRLVFRAQRHRWTVRYPYGCLGVEVQRDHHQLPTLESTGVLRKRLRAAWRGTATR